MGRTKKKKKKKKEREKRRKKKSGMDQPSWEGAMREERNLHTGRPPN